MTWRTYHVEWVVRCSARCWVAFPAPPGVRGAVNDLNHWCAEGGHTGIVMCVQLRGARLRVISQTQLPQQQLSKFLYNNSVL
jgi:hypothetical protein